MENGSPLFKKLWAIKVFEVKCFDNASARRNGNEDKPKSTRGVFEIMKSVFQGRCVPKIRPNSWWGDSKKNFVYFRSYIPSKPNYYRVKVWVKYVLNA